MPCRAVPLSLGVANGTRPASGQGCLPMDGLGSILPYFQKGARNHCGRNKASLGVSPCWEPRMQSHFWGHVTCRANSLFRLHLSLPCVHFALPTSNMRPPSLPIHHFPQRTCGHWDRHKARFRAPLCGVTRVPSNFRGRVVCSVSDHFSHFDHVRRIPLSPFQQKTFVSFSSKQHVPIGP